jgi:Zn-finger nucleic acid-binding protein
MKCPVCKSSELVSGVLDENLTSLNCPHCGGNWIRGAEYWKWVENHGSDLAERLHYTESLSLAEPGLPLDCPECRFRMVKFLVGRGLSFTLDHCEGCKGIWLDQNEWEALKKRNLHDDLNLMFTAFWQKEAQRELRKKRMEEIYANRFGADDYAEIKRVRWWLDTKTNREELLAFLIDKEPFDA